MADSDSEKMKGTAKEMAGKVTGSDEMAKEGQSQQEKAEAEQKAKQAEAQADAAENTQDRHSGD